MTGKTRGFCLSLKSRWIDFAVAMKLCNPVAFKTFHLILFPVDIRLIPLYPTKIFHTHTASVTAVARLVYWWTLKKLVSSKKAASSRSLPEDMAASTRCMTFETCFIDDGFDRRPLFAGPLVHYGIGSPKCGMKTCPKGLNNFLMTGNAKTLHLCGSCPFSLMSHLFITCLIIPSMTFHTTKLPVRGL